MSCLAPPVAEPARRALRIGRPPTAQEAACWVVICRLHDEHVSQCPRKPSELQLAASRLHWKLRQRREGR